MAQWLLFPRRKPVFLIPSYLLLACISQPSICMQHDLFLNVQVYICTQVNGKNLQFRKGI